MSTSVAPSARARSSPRKSPRYSATLLVATPIGSPTSSSTSPSGVDTTTPAAAGPGLPRAPPSTWTTNLKSEPGRPGVVSLGGELGKLAGNARPPAIADGAVAATGRGPAPPRRLAAVDDHLDVGVVGVVVLKLRQKLVGELLRNNAVDHANHARGGRGRPPSNVCLVRDRTPCTRIICVQDLACRLEADYTAPRAPCSS